MEADARALAEDGPEPLGEVTLAHGGAEVRLPAAFARAAVQLFEEWGFRARPTVEAHVYRVDHRASHLLLRALEHVKPERLGPDGLPLPWIAAPTPTEALDDRLSVEDDVVRTRTLPAATGADAHAELKALFERLRGLAGLPDFELRVQPLTEDHRGFCRGRIWLDLEGRPLRVLLRPCPNGDAAEHAATLVHEVAHACTPGDQHGARFKEALLGLAKRAWGDAYFVVPTPGDAYAEVDRWVTTGIRAALAGGPPPARRTGDAGDTAKVVTRIRKLRALAADQLGSPEAISATARANDLVTTYGLGDYAVQVPAGIDEQMVDRWVQVAPRQVWQRMLAGVVARFFGVFSLSMAKDARMHLFGRHADVVAATFLTEVSIEKIERACDAHIARWKRTHRPNGGQVRSERITFCDNAVLGFRAKLQGIRDAERKAGGDATDRALSEARAAAEVEHERRGLGWNSGARRTVRAHEAGQRAGAALSVAHGVGGGEGGPRMLKG